MISSDFVLYNNPVIVIDGSTEIPDEIKNRVSFKSSSKILIDTPISSYPGGNHILIMKEFSKEKIEKLLHTEELAALKGVYTLSGLDKSLHINDKIPVIPDTYAKSKGITDPDAHLHKFVSMIATDMGFTHEYVPWENPTDSKDMRWRDLSYGVECIHYTNKTLRTVYPYTAWLSYIIKTKNYEQRKKEIIAMNNMVSSKASYVDEFVLFGDGDFVTKERFPGTVGSSKVVYETTSGKKKVDTLGDMFDYAWSHFPKQSIVFITRGDITLPNTEITKLYSRFPSNIFGLMNPITLPDVPDPKLELFNRGIPEVVFGCVYRTKKRPIQTPSILNSIHTHMQCSFGVAAELASKRNINITNISSTLLSWIPTGTIPMFLSNKLNRIPQVRIPVGNVICALLREKRTHVWNLPTEDSTEIIKIPMMTSHLGTTENKTLMNMTNKYASRNGGENWKLTDDTSREHNVGTVLPFVDATGCLFYKNYWIHNPSHTGSLYDGMGIKSKNGLLCSEPSTFSNSIIIGIPDTRITTFVGTLAYMSIYTQSEPSHAKKMIYMILPEDCDEGKTTMLTNMFDKLTIPFKFAYIKNGYIVGTPGNITIGSNSELKYLGYDPRVIRVFNRNFQCSYISHPDSIEDVLDDISPSRSVKKDTRHTAILVGGTKWRKCIKNELETNTKLRLIYSEDATRDDYTNASYIIGTADNDDWAFTTFVNSEKCRIIEIAPEYDCNTKWFHLAATSVGCEHMYLSLKQEPSKQCKKRIKTHLLAYIREEDKISSDEHSVETSA
jgi:hypothetical protein